jgi:hypothetical protein
MSSCITLVVTAFTAVFMGGTMPIGDCNNFSCLLQSPTPSVFLTPTTTASVTYTASTTETATPTVSSNFYYRPDAFDPESVCDDRSAFVKYIPCTNTVALSKNNIYETSPDRTVESDTWQIPGEENEYTHISYIGIPLQVLFSSLRISLHMNCTTMNEYIHGSNKWTIHTASAFTVEYSELPTYENIWFKLKNPAIVRGTDVCQVKMRMSGSATVSLQKDRFDDSFEFGLIA